MLSEFIGFSIGVATVGLITKLLGKKKERINLEGATPLIKAIHDRKYEMAKKLIKNGADLNGHTVDGVTALSLTILRGSETPELLDFAELLIVNGAVIYENDLLDALTLTVNEPHMYDFVSLLVATGIDMNIHFHDEDGGNLTPLLYVLAVASQHAHMLNLVPLLINGGANPNVLSIQGAMEISPLLQVLMDLHEAPHMQNMVSRLIEAEANVNQKCKFEDAVLVPLYIILISESKRKYKIADYLIQHGADVNIKIDGTEHNLLSLLMSENTEGEYDDAIEFLIDNGAK